MSLNFEELDEQFDAGKCKEVMDILEKSFAEKEDIEVGWRLARCQFETGSTVALVFSPGEEPQSLVMPISRNPGTTKRMKPP